MAILIERKSNIKSVTLKPVKTDKVDEKGRPIYEKRIVIEKKEGCPKISEVYAVMKKRQQDQSREQ
ncbi:MAG: hypothetical protein IJF22_02880 [Clostridia bacterium]|nr:hypothetical protein [Clostridia bacterium]